MIDQVAHYWLQNPIETILLLEQIKQTSKQIKIRYLRSSSV